MKGTTKEAQASIPTEHVKDSPNPNQKLTMRRKAAKRTDLLDPGEAVETIASPPVELTDKVPLRLDDTQAPAVTNNTGTVADAPPPQLEPGEFGIMAREQYDLTDGAVALLYQLELLKPGDYGIMDPGQYDQIIAALKAKRKFILWENKKVSLSAFITGELNGETVLMKLSGKKTWKIVLQPHTAYRIAETLYAQFVADGKADVKGRGAEARFKSELGNKCVISAIRFLDETGFWKEKYRPIEAAPTAVKAKAYDALAPDVTNSTGSVVDSALRQLEPGEFGIMAREQYDLTDEVPFQVDDYPAPVVTNNTGAVAPLHQLKLLKPGDYGIMDSKKYDFILAALKAEKLFTKAEKLTILWENKKVSLSDFRTGEFNGETVLMELLGHGDTWKIVLQPHTAHHIAEAMYVQFVADGNSDAKGWSAKARFKTELGEKCAISAIRFLDETGFWAWERRLIEAARTAVKAKAAAGQADTTHVDESRQLVAFGQGRDALPVAAGGSLIQPEPSAQTALVSLGQGHRDALPAAAGGTLNEATPLTELEVLVRRAAGGRNNAFYEKVYPILEANDLDVETVAELSLDELHKVGIDTIGKRKRLL
jgi:hypothetical protein